MEYQWRKGCTWRRESVAIDIIETRRYVREGGIQERHRRFCCEVWVSFADKNKSAPLQSAGGFYLNRRPNSH